MYKSILFLGTGQIGKAVLKMVLKRQPQKIIIHNLTKVETDRVVNKFEKLYPNIEIIASYGNVFMPHKLKNLTNKNLYEKANEVIEFFYNEMNTKVFEQSSIYTLISKYKPDLIIDAINSATVLGNEYNPERTKEILTRNPTMCCKDIMVNDYTTKIINFVYSLQYAIKKFGVKKYVKVSTTGLGGMGVNMPYTHGDNPKVHLSAALMGKISASGILHQLLWNLSHTNDVDISLVIPATFVGYDSVLNEPIETDKGLLRKYKVPNPIDIKIGVKLNYNTDLETDDYLTFPVVRAGENHVYSNDELKVLTAIGQMEAITKEEVANNVIDCIYGKSKNDIFKAMDSAMLEPTYFGREMIYEIEAKMQKMEHDCPAIATGNLGVTLSKQLYELSLIKQCCSTITELMKTANKNLVENVNSRLTEYIVSEIISIGIPIINNKMQLLIGEYSLVPAKNEDKTLSNKNIDNWSKIGWVDTREKNITNWKKILISIYNDAQHERQGEDLCINKQISKISDDYDIAEYLAYFNNINLKGRKK